MKLIKRILGIVLLLALIAGSLWRVSYYLENKDSKCRYSSFFKEKQDFDVLFMGASHVRYGVFPMELWNDYGMTSFNLAADGNTIPVSYWILVNALDYKTPKVVVMDIYDIWPRVISSKSGQVHGQMDAFPLTKNKIDMVNDLYNKDNLTEETINSDAYAIYDRKYTLLWPFSEYHTRWNDLKEPDFITESEMLEASDTWKGSEPYAGVVERKKKEYSNDTSGLVYDDLSEKYLTQMIDLCKEKNIELLLINTGYDCSDESKFFADSVNGIAEANGLPYLDFTKMDIIDFGCDLFSTGENSHVNFSGAEKYTAFIGEYLNSHYNLPDHRGDANYEKWENDFNLYEESKQKYLLESKNLTEYLMYLYDDRYQAIIEVGNKESLEDEITKNLLANLGVDASDISSDTNMIVVDTQEKNGECYSCEYNSAFDTVIGTVSIFTNPEQTEYGLYLNGDEVKVQEIGDEYDFRITVFDKNDGSVLDIRDFYESAENEE